jgi:hypothetical protein
MQKSPSVCANYRSHIQTRQNNFHIQVYFFLFQLTNNTKNANSVVIFRDFQGLETPYQLHYQSI